MVETMEKRTRSFDGNHIKRNVCCGPEHIKNSKR